MKNLRGFTVRFVLLIVVAIGIGSCSTTDKLTEPASPPPATEPKLNRAVSLEAIDGYMELLPAGKDLPATASETLIYGMNGEDSGRVTISQSDGPSHETIADVDLPTLTKESNVVITVKVDSQKQLRLKISVMESAFVKELGPFPVE